MNDLMRHAMPTHQPHSHVSEADYQRTERTLDEVKRLYHAAKYDDVLRLCNGELAERNWSPLFLIARAETLERMHRFDDALRDFKQIVELIPTHTPSCVGAARCLRSMKQAHEALKYYDYAVYADPLVGSEEGSEKANEGGKRQKERDLIHFHFILKFFLLSVPSCSSWSC
jgi:tetratricopeptide (TPR) repeat protein